MARRRMIDPDFWASKRFFLRILNTTRELFPTKTERFVYQTCANCRFFYIGLWNFADDYGKFVHDSCKIKGEILPYDKYFTSHQIETMIKILQHAQRIYLYTVVGVDYGIILNFLEHQTISHPTASKIPNPQEEEFSRNFPETFRSLSGATPSQVKLSLRLREVKLREEPDKTLSSFPENQNATPPPKPKYEPGPKFCSPGCGKPMADEGDKWYCVDCGIRKPKREVK